MIVLRIIGCILLLTVIFVLLGKLLCGKTHNPVLEWVVGFFAVLAFFEVISLPCIFLRRSLKELSLVMFAVIGGLCLISFGLHGRELIEAVKEFRWKKPEMLVVVVLLLVLLQTFVLGFGNHIDDDDAFYVATAVTAVDTNTLYAFDPYTGSSYYEFPARYVLSPFPLLGAVIGKWIGIRPTVFFHTVLPFVLIPLAYGVYFLIGNRVFGENREKIAWFLIFLSLVNLFSGFSPWSVGEFLLVRIWQGKAVLAAILLPFLIYFVLCHFEKNYLTIKEWILLFVVMVASCFVSSMGIILSAIMLEAFAIMQVFRSKKIKLFIQTSSCCILNVALAGIYLFMR
ncbi:MAG: DUF6077 domain-containing protein [Roseburia sp.]